MTQDELEVININLFEQCLEKVKRGEPIIPGFWRHKDGELVFHDLGYTAALLNSGEGKARLFALIRLFIEATQSDTCFISTEAWEFIPNETAPANWTTMIDKGFKTLVKMGYGKVYQVIWLIGQTPETVVLMSRRFEELMVNGTRKIIFYGDTKKVIGPQATYEGRSKMFGPGTFDKDVEDHYNFLRDEIEKQKAAGE